jgi:phosphohistidine phosphatase SixA
MNSYLSHVVVDVSARYHALHKLSRLMLLSLSLLIMASAAAYALRPAPLTDLADGRNLRKADFYALWDKGDLVVLMRHSERCDHSTNPCLAEGDGITRKGMELATQTGESLRQLGLNNADIYNSPLRRTEQTSAFVFHRTTAGQKWLVNCRNTMLDDVLAHKVGKRNLVLVTHSECINAMEKSLGVPAPESLDYAASLVVKVDPVSHSAHVLGYIDAQNWGAVLAKRP